MLALSDISGKALVLRERDEVAFFPIFSKFIKPDILFKVKSRVPDFLLKSIQIRKKGRSMEEDKIDKKAKQEEEINQQFRRDLL